MILHRFLSAFIGRDLTMVRCTERRFTRLHLGNQLLVEHPPGLFVQRAVDGDNITLAQHVLQLFHTPAANLLLDIGLQGLVVIVQQLLAVKRLQPSEHSLTNPTHSNGSHDLALEIILVFGGRSHVPVAGLDLLVGGDKVADEGQDGHEDVLGDGDDVGAGDFGDRDPAVGLVGGIEVDVVRADTRGDGDLELLGFGETLWGQVARVEAVGLMAGLADARLGSSSPALEKRTGDSIERAYGVVMMTSASTNSWSNLEFSPSLSEVVTRVWPLLSSHGRIPSSFSVVPSSSGTSLACSWPCASDHQHPRGLVRGAQPAWTGLVYLHRRE